MAVLLIAVAAGGAAGGLAGAYFGHEQASPAPAAATVMPASSPTATQQAATPTATPVPTPTAPSPGASTTKGIGAIPDMLAVLRPSIVAIDVVSQATGFRGQPTTVKGAGSGFVTDAAGLIATNAHVVEGAQSITVSFWDGASLPATIVGSDDAADLAIIHVDRAGLTPAMRGRTGEVRVGELVVAVGNALALPGGPTASLGIVSALNREVTTSDGKSYVGLLQVDAAINPGDSGGPLIDIEGHVIGINTVGSSSAQSIGFAIPMLTAETVLVRLSDGADAR